MLKAYLFLEINASNNRLINQSNKKQTKREREREKRDKNNIRTRQLNRKWANV